MKKHTLRKKTVNYLMLGVALSSAALLLVNTPEASAAEMTPEAAQLLSEKVDLPSAVIYEDAKGVQTIPVAQGTTVRLSATNTTINMTIGKQKYALKDVKNITFKGITVDRLIPFYSNTVEKVTLDGVNFTKGIDFSGMKNINTLIVKDSTFGATDYSLAIHGAPALTNFVVDKSSFDADVRIYSNKSLEKSYLSNSVFKKDVSQYSNKKGYATENANNRYERSKTQRVINSGGMSQDDVFYINQNDTKIGATTNSFDASKDGFIAYTENGVPKKINVPAGVQVTSLVDTRDTVTVKLSNGYTQKVTGSEELYFRNVDVQAPTAFVSKNLQLKKVSYVNSRTRLIDIAYSKSITDVQVINTTISEKSGYLSVYNNDSMKNVELQNSEVTGTSGYISVYNNKNLDKYVMNDVYTHGYLSAYNLGGVTLQISNSLFDDYISTNQNIEGEGGRAKIGYAPELSGVKDLKFEKGSPQDLIGDVKAIDFEDGDITSMIQIDDSEVNWAKKGKYTVTYTVTDSDGNSVSKTAQVAVN